MKKTIIIGAGISGLSAAYFLKKPYTILEQKPYAGGLCASFYENGFTFDCSGHFIHIKDEKIKKLVAKLTGGIDEISRNASIYLHDKFIPYPFQANLYYLDEKTKKECVDGILKRKNIEASTSMPFADWSEAMFGKGITKYFMKPYNQKLWSFDLKKMTAEWSGAFVPKPDAQSIVKSAYSKNKVSYGYNSVFYYPKQKGCQALIDGLAEKVKINLNEKTSKIDIKNKIVKTQNGQYKYDNIISTQPLPELIKQISNVPANVKKAVSKLLCTQTRCVNIGVKSSKGIPVVLKNRHWVYLPENKFPFYRIGMYSNVSRGTAPKNSYSFYVEFSSADGKYKSSENVIKDLIKAGFIRKDDEIAGVNIIDMPYAYVIFDKNRFESLETIKSFLNKNGIFSIGRYGAWEYSFIEKNIKDAKATAERINNLQ
ncbi:MAG: FAD-dependent oxidoreductase [Endomicrobia bacterium]|nr:FAD-dependent oxidoreductase [Endomicrobiia bacterium]MCL2506727.1 FAD-dependent oxidoreductase [Endomicrobiia bacterium]